MAKIALSALFIAIAAVPASHAQVFRTNESQTIETATQVLDQLGTDPLRGIPQSLLSHAQAVAIVPDVLKGGLFVGARHGKGVLLIRDETGNWRPPMFITLTGGSFGWQIGLQASDVVLVFRTRRSVDALLKGKLTVGADAAVAAGPVGREAAAGTDAFLKAEIFTYAQSRGLFAGLALDGSVVLMDARANAAFYGPPPHVGTPKILPPSAVRLTETLARHTGRPVPGAKGIAPTESAHLEQARLHLVDSALRLDPVLPEMWKSYLALPAEIVSGKAPPPVDAVAHLKARYDQVAKDTRFSALTSRPEFRAAHDALSAYQGQLRVRPVPLELPPPPK